MNIPTQAEILELSLTDPTIRTIVNLQEAQWASGERLPWSDALALMVVHLAVDKARLVEALLDCINSKPGPPIIITSEKDL